ncbi:MAG TPA: carotenoid biosynthesis protein [Streptosporangiaceae bacterium]|nr:carotenoid biosynthesis protein [Streptosporangiaceae bacterium]
MAILQVMSARAGHLILFTTLIVLVLATSSVAFAAVRAGWPRALAAAAAAFLLGLAAEWAGTRTGFPFGAYHYTGRLRPAVGGVPLLVPLAWAGMGLPGYAVGQAITRHRAGQIAAGAVALTAWDLFLDPQMLRNGFWRWAHPGPYQGVPLTNFAGWLLVSAILMSACAARLGPGRPHRGLLASYSVMAVMETAGFAAVFPHGRPAALAGGLGMAIPAVLAWARVGRDGARDD